MDLKQGLMKFVDAQVTRHPDLTRRLMTRMVASGTSRLIVFLTPNYEARNGGVIAIATYCRETLALKHVHGCRTALCAFPGASKILKQTWYENRDYILDLESVLEACGPLDFLMIHIPAIAVDLMVDWLSRNAQRLRSIASLHLNILVMNIDNIQGKDIPGLKRFGTVTATTAHEAYSTQAVRRMLDVPLHRLSVWIGAQDYRRSSYRDKQDILVVSPDPSPAREPVLAALRERCPFLQIIVIENMAYEDYKRLIGRAKWSLTFGEGLDGYFIEPVFSGSVSFAVWNDRYFTPAFKELETVYSSWEDLVARMPSDIVRLNAPAEFDRLSSHISDLLRTLYDTDKFRDNLRKFYRGDYTYP